jgi:hypothetical protein
MSSPLLAPLARLAQCRLAHPERQQADEAGVLGERDELGRRDQPPLGMGPAQQRLGAVDAAGQVDLRLVVQDELVAVDGPAQVGEQREPRGAGLIARAVVHGHAETGALGLVHGDVGVLDERVGVPAVVRIQRLAQLSGDGGRGGGVPEARKQDVELVATEPGDRVARAQALADLV